MVTRKPATAPEIKKVNRPAAQKKVAGAAVYAGKKADSKIAVSGTPEKKRGAVGRPSLYNLELAHSICEHIANCVPMRTIAAMDGMPSFQTMMNWLAGKPEFLDLYARAREAQADKMAEDILAIADEECTTVRADKHGTADDGEGNTEVIFDSTAVQRNRLRVDARKWLAAKMAPKKYGDRVETTLTGPNGGPIQSRIEIEFVRPKPRQEGDDA